VRLPRQRSKLALYAQHPWRISRRLHSRLPLACELLRLNDLRGDHFRGDHIAFLEIFVAIFFIQSHDVRKRPDNQPLWLSAATSGTLAALRASRFALWRCRSAFSACFRRSVCRDIRAPVSGIVSREESYAQGVKRPHGARSYTSASLLIGGPEARDGLWRLRQGIDRRRDRHRGDHRDRSRASSSSPAQ
jgi:hypothetical protein